jgi:hypothetical protein
VDHLEKQNEEMRNDIDMLKIHMAQILEKLSELGQKEKEGTSQRNIMESSSQGIPFILTYSFVPLTYQLPQQPTIESLEERIAIWPST